MLIRPVVHELDSNAVFLRQQIISLHHKKLSQIKKRKNVFEVETSTSLFQKQFNKMKMQAEKLNPNSGFHNSQNIKENNTYLTSKLSKISKRINKTLFPDILNENNKTRNKSIHSIQALKEKKLKEDNHYYVFRLNKKSSCINIRKLEQDFKLNQEVERRLRRIKPKNISLNTYDEEEKLFRALEISLVNHSKERTKR